MLYKVPLIECKGESNVNHNQKYMQGLNHEACGIVDALGRDNESRQEGGMKNKPKSPWSLGTTCDLLKSKSAKESNTPYVQESQALNNKNKQKSETNIWFDGWI